MVESFGTAVMRLLRVRFTVRRLMAVVAITAMLFWSAMEGRRLVLRVRFCQRWANLHALTEVRYRGMAAQAQSNAVRVQSTAFREKRLARFGISPSDPQAAMVPMIDPAPIIHRASRYSRLAQYHARQSTRFASAAWRPWLRVTPEPAPEEP